MICDDKIRENALANSEAEAIPESADSGKDKIEGSFKDTSSWILKTNKRIRYP